MKFLANLFGGGQEGVVRYALARQKAVRRHRRAETVGDIDRETADRMLREANCTREEADAIYKLTALEWQITIPPNGRLPSHGIAPAVIQWESDSDTGIMLTLHHWGGVDCAGTASPTILANELNVVAVCVNNLQSGPADFGGGNITLMANKLARRTFTCVIDMCGMKKLSDDIAFALPGGSDLATII